MQIALDHNDLEHALGDVMKVGDVVDIIEVGTILCLQEGQKRFAVFAVCSQIKLVADTKCADAGGTVAVMLQSRSRLDDSHLLCNDSNYGGSTKEIGELQVELYGNWTLNKPWIGITSVSGR